MNSHQEAVEHQHQPSHQAEAHHDPLQSIQEQAPTLTRSWLLSGESMSLIQRIGFTIISLNLLLGGFFLLSWAIQFLKAGKGTFIFLALPSVALLLFGTIGLRNVLRFPGQR